MTTPKNNLNFSYIFNITLSALLAIFSWNAIRLINSVDDLTKMVYEHEVQITEQGKRLDKIENKIITEYHIPNNINDSMPKDGTVINYFNREICIIGSTSYKSKRNYMNV